MIESMCNCYNCQKNTYHFSKGVPTNMSVRNCDVNNKYFDCYNTKVFKEQIEPRNLKGFINLNPDAINSQYDKTFGKVEYNFGYNDSDKKTGYLTNDPRLISAIRGGQKLVLDTPPINGGQIKLKDIYTDKTLENYGKKYNSYTDIKAGDIVYYIDRSIEDAFIPQIYQNNAYDTGILYQDPMTSMKPQYIRQPVYENNHLDTKRDNYNHGLSWLDDSIEQREDLIARQQLKNNQQKYSSRWTGNIHI